MLLNQLLKLILKKMFFLFDFHFISLIWVINCLAILKIQISNF